MVLTANGFDIITEVVCSDDEELLEMLNTEIRAVPEWSPPKRWCTANSLNNNTIGARDDTRRKPDRRTRRQS